MLGLSSFDFVRLEIVVKCSNPGVDMLQAIHEVVIKKELEETVKKQNFRFITDEDDRIELLDKQTIVIYDFNANTMNFKMTVRYNTSYFRTGRTQYEVTYDPHNAWFSIKNPDGSFFTINETFDRITLPNANFISFSSCNHDWRYGKMDEEGNIYNWCATCGEKDFKVKKERYL